MIPGEGSGPGAGGPRGRKRAVVLLSGGMDSATAMAVAGARGYELFALTVDYGQRHARELRAAARLARFFGAREHRVIRSGLGALGGSALTDTRLRVPEGRKRRRGEVPVTYVPARNLVLLSYAAAYAERVGAGAVFIGANVVDYSGYPDCRPEFLSAFERAARAGTKTGARGRGIRVVAPLLRMSKAEIVREGTRLGVPFGLTWSCYGGGRRPCGHCDACLLRARGFREAGIRDPLSSHSASGADGGPGRRGAGRRKKRGGGREETRGGARGRARERGTGTRGASR